MTHYKLSAQSQLVIEVKFRLEFKQKLNQLYSLMLSIIRIFCYFMKILKTFFRRFGARAKRKQTKNFHVSCEAERKWNETCVDFWNPLNILKETFSIPFLLLLIYSIMDFFFFFGSAKEPKLRIERISFVSINVNKKKRDQFTNFSMVEKNRRKTIRFVYVQK